MEKEVIKTSNKFDVLGNEKIEKGSQEWEDMKKKIDMACMLGMNMSDEDRNKWSDDLVVYWEELKAAKVKESKVN